MSDHPNRVVATNGSHSGPSSSFLNDEARRERIGLLDLYEIGEADLSRPQYDSRNVKPGDAFVAIRGFETDGHRYISQAIANGAKTIVLEDPNAFTRQDAERSQVSRILVKNSRTALAFISEWAFGDPSTKLRMIGVTGTNGKTTVTNLIRQLLMMKGEKVGLLGTIGNWIGDEQIPATHTTPESRDISELLARMVEENVSTCVMEASSHALALERVVALDFDIAVFTNLTRDHLDFHKTMEAYLAAKKKLFDTLKDTAVAITNADDENGLAIVKDTIANVHTYGIRKNGSNHADLLAFDLDLSSIGTKFILEKRYSNERAEFNSPLIGRINVENVLAASSALYFGVEGFSLDVLAGFVPKLEAPRGRFERIALKNGASAIIDYAHTPDALENVLIAIRAIMKQGKIITVFGCGGDRDKGKRPQMGAIAAALSDEVIVTSDNPRSENPNTIIEEVLSGISGSDRKHVQTELDRAEAINIAISKAKSGDIVLLAGKGHENYQIIGNERRQFDDREEVLKYNA